MLCFRQFWYKEIYLVQNFHGVKLSVYPWCQIVLCQIVLVPNCLVPNCLAPNCPMPNCPGSKLSYNHQDFSIICICFLFVFVLYFHLSWSEREAGSHRQGSLTVHALALLCWQLMPLTPLSNARQCLPDLSRHNMHLFKMSLNRVEVKSREYLPLTALSNASPDTTCILPQTEWIE